MYMKMVVATQTYMGKCSLIIIENKDLPERMLLEIYLSGDGERFERKGFPTLNRFFKSDGTIPENNIF